MCSAIATGRYLEHYYHKYWVDCAILFTGSCVLIHGQVVHFSEKNKTDKPRNAYTFHIIEQKDTKYSEDNWIQPPEGKEFLNLYKN